MVSKTQSKLFWFNFKTKEYDFIETPDNLIDYIPQDPSAIGLYECLIALGKEPIEAAIEVLNACLPKRDDERKD